MQPQIPWLGRRAGVFSPASAHKGLWNKDRSTWKRHPSCVELLWFMGAAGILGAKGGGHARSGRAGGSLGVFGHGGPDLNLLAE